MKSEVRLAVTLTACVCSRTFCGKYCPYFLMLSRQIYETPEKIGWMDVKNLDRRT